MGAAVGFATGMWTGGAVSLALAFHRTSWGGFNLARLWLNRRHGLPHDLMQFFKDAHEIHGILRRVGPVYQFRHIDLQRHLASRPSP